MKPKLKNNFVHCLAMFKPNNMSSDVWESLDGDELGDAAEWAAFRVIPDAIYAYNRSSIRNAVTIWIDRSSITVTGKIEDWDEILNDDSERGN